MQHKMTKFGPSERHTTYSKDTKAKRQNRQSLA